MISRRHGGSSNHRQGTTQHRGRCATPMPHLPAIVSDEDGEARRERIETLRKRQQKALSACFHSAGGANCPPDSIASAADDDDESFSLLLDLISGRLTYEEVAQLLHLERYGFWRRIQGVLSEFRWAWLAELVVDALAMEDDVWLNAATSEMVLPKRGFGVTMPKSIARLDNPDCEATLAYFRLHRKLLLSESFTVYFHGSADHAEDVFVFKLVMVYPDLDAAMVAANKQRQTECFDFAKRQWVSFGENEGRKAA